MIYTLLQDIEPDYSKPVFIIVAAIGAVVLFNLLIFFEATYVEYIKQKPLFNHKYFRLKRLTVKEQLVLKKEFPFYQKLSDKEKAYFEHRVLKFIKEHEFIGMEEFLVDYRIKVLIASTAIMLTFGYKNYRIRQVNKFLVYPDVFYSETNKELHKGEYNLGFKAIALSWKDFEKGFDVANDNLNLGIHEYVHAMHLNFLKADIYNTSAIIFLKGYKKLKAFLDDDEAYKERVVRSKYFRDYAFTNQFEFASVIIETFIETPKAFKAQFPELYKKVRAMLNFDFAGY